MKQFLTTVLFWVVFAGAKSQSLQLTAPNGGELWLGGSTHNISWTYTNVDNIRIEYSLNNGLTWNLISASYPSSALSYAWRVPCIGSTLAKVRITNVLQFTQDESNAPFTIPQGIVDISYPNGGESFGTGTGQYIEWTSSGITTLQFQYTADSGQTWTDIGSFPAANQYANWVMPSTLSNRARIRAFNVENTIDRDSSEQFFQTFPLSSADPSKYRGGPQDGYNMCSNLPDTLRVLSPNGGEVYSPTNSVTIHWSYRHIDDIKLEYSTDNGNTWTLIVSDIPASRLSYNWIIPNAPSNQCRIKITSLRSGLTDISDAAFTINAAFVNLIYPNGSESFGGGTGQYIEWDHNAVANVKLEYSTDNGNAWTLIGTAPAANKYANWVTPTNITNQCLIRISDNDLPSVSDQSETSFILYRLPNADQNKFRGGANDGYSMNSNLKDSLKLISPNGGEQWTSASTRTIHWSYNEVDNIAIEYSLDDGQTWTTLVSNIPASQLSYNWTIPTTPSYTCRVRIKDMTRPIADESDSVFVIPTAYVQILYPNGGERFGTGTGQYIEWAYNDLATIKLEYSTDSGSTWNVIGTAPASNQYANWVAPALPTEGLLIRATDINNPIYTDQSDLPFTIYRLPQADPAKYRGGEQDGYSMYAYKDVYVKVIKPNGGEIWGNGTTQQIQWATLNTQENLKVEYSIDNEQTWTTLLNDVPSVPNTYNWTISSPVSSICKVRATTMSGTVFDKSDNFFTIANPNGIVTNPISGSPFCSGASATVTYSLNRSFNSGNRFIVQLSDTSGSFNGSVINIGEVTATAATPISVQFPSVYFTSSRYRLRVVATNPPTIGTDNGSNFTIRALPLVNLGNDTVICPGSTITLRAGAGATSYLWSNGARTSSINITEGGIYWVDVTNACGTTRDSITVTQKRLPTVDLGLDTAICINTSITLNAGDGDNQYLWSTGSTNASIQVLVPGTYSVTVSNVCGAATDQRTITNRPATVVELGANRGLCSGQTLVLDAGNPGATYVWSTGATTQTINVTTPGTYSVRVDQGCGAVSDQVTVFNGAFTVNAGVDQTICRGDSIRLMAIGANQYLWSTGQAGNCITVMPSSTTTYSVTGTNIYGCTSTDQVRVVVNALPDAPRPTILGDSVYCANRPGTLQANAGAGLTYQWMQQDIAVSGSNGIRFSPEQTGQYAVRVTNESGCARTSPSVSVTVLPVTEARVLALGGTSICAGTSVDLQGNVGDGFTYQWLRNGMAMSSGDQVRLRVVESGSYALVLTGANGCRDTSDATTVTVKALPVAVVQPSGNLQICAGDELRLQAQVNAAYRYRWQKNGTDITGATGSFYDANAAGIYTVTVRDSGDCPVTSDAVVVSERPLERLDTSVVVCGSFTWNATGQTYTQSGIYTTGSGCTIKTLQLSILTASDTTINVSNCGSYTWNGVTYTQSGTFTWSYTNGNGCPSVDTLHLTINAEHDYYWIGGVSAAWEEQTNWSCGMVPNEQSNVYVQEGAQHPLEVKSQAVCNRLYLRNGKSVRVFPGHRLRVISNP